MGDSLLTNDQSWRVHLGGRRSGFTARAATLPPEGPPTGDPLVGDRLGPGRRDSAAEGVLFPEQFRSSVELDST